jgi:hypothetical protein
MLLRLDYSFERPMAAQRFALRVTAAGPAALLRLGADDCGLKFSHGDYLVSYTGSSKMKLPAGPLRAGYSGIQRSDSNA